MAALTAAQKRERKENAGRDLAHAVDFHGRFLRDILDGKCKDHDDDTDNVPATAARVSSILHQLSFNARYYGPVTHEQIDAAIKQLHEAMGVEEVETRMGGTVYRRKEKVDG